MKNFTILVTGSGEWPLQPTLEDEAYTLTINKEKGIHIESPTAYGAINGITTLIQLVTCKKFDKKNQNSFECSIPNGPFEVKD